jgi:preprotein translocase subunit SecG
LITLVTIIHVAVCVFLILVILLQAGKGGGMAGLGGGGASQTVFGGRGSQTLLGKVTSAFAAIFMITSLTLAYQASKTASVVERGGAAPFAPAPGAPAPGAPAPSAPAQAPAQQAPAAPAQGGTAPSH